MDNLFSINHELQEENLKLKKRIRKLEQWETERKLTENEMKKMHNILTEGQKIAHVGSFEYVLDTTETIWSEEEYRIYGLDPAMPSPRYEIMLAESIHPDDAELLHKTFTEALKNRSVFELEHRIVLPDRSVRWLYNRAHPYFDENGKLIRYIGTTMDITESMRAEEEIRMFMESVENSSDAVGMSTPGGEHFYQNKAFDTLFGQVGKNPVETLYVNPNIGQEIFRAIISGGQWIGEVEMYDKNRKIRTFLLRAYASKDKKDRLTALVGVHTDITGRKEAEHALHESEERLKLCMEATNDGLWDWNVKTDQGYFNPGYYHMLGYEVGDFPAKGEAWKKLIHPDDIKKVLDINIDCIQGRSEKFEVEYRLKTKSGDWCWVLGRGKCVARDEQGCATRMIGTHIDITERKQMEKTLVEKEEQYRNFFSMSKDCVFITTEDGRWINLNDAAAQIFGYDNREELLKIKVSDLYANPEDRERFKQLIKDSGYTQNLPIALRKKDGTVIDALATSTVKKDSMGKVVGYQGTIRDITVYKRAMLLLQASEERFRSLVETTSDWIWETDVKGIYTYSSPKVKDILGYEALEILGKTPVDLMPSVEAARIADTVLQHFKEKMPFAGFESLNLHKDGRIVILETNAVPVVDENGRLAGYRGVNRDITARKDAEEELYKSEATLRSVFKATPIGLCLMKDRIFQSVNNAFFKNTGYSESEIIGHTPRMLYVNDKEYKRVEQELFAGLLQLGLTSVQTKHRRKDGSLRDIVLTAAPLQTKEILSGMAVVTVEDITDRKRVEEKLYNSRKHLANIIEFLPDATLVIDKKGTVIAWNRAIEIMTGVKKEDMIGKGNHEYTLPFYGSRRPALIDAALNPNRKIDKQYTAIQRMGDVLFGEAFTPNLPSGNTHVSATASVLRDEKGKITAAIECIRDNTERKKLEERLNRAEKMEALGTLAGGVAHDLNNVLGALIGYAEMMQEYLPKDHIVVEFAENIFQSGIRATAIIQDMLTMARRGVTVSDIINLNDQIANYLKTPEFENLKIGNPRVEISIKLENNLLNIKGSHIHLAKTIMNLVSNAVESIFGKGKISIKTENRYLDQPIHGYDTMQEGDYVVLIVSDNGSGISANDIDKIFEPFYTKKVMGRSGTGLGLAVVWGTVKDHNGYIDVQSEEGKGTTFSLYFPVTREEPPKAEKKVSYIFNMGKGESILVVDDVPEQRKLAGIMLEKLGYRVNVVAGGEEAIEFLKDNKADLILLDMIMAPGIDGLETYRRIRNINPGQKAIIVSGYSETDQVKEVQKLGAGEFVRKPYMIGKIGTAIKKELEKKTKKSSV